MAKRKVKTSTQKDLQVDEDLKFQKRYYIVKKIGLLALYLFIIIAFFGLNGMIMMFRATAIYLFLLVLVRVAGKRSLDEITTFDFLLVLIISEAANPVLIGEEHSLKDASIIISTLFALDILLNQIKKLSKTFEKWSEGTPVVIVENGKTIDKLMKEEGVQVEDVLQYARQTQGIERLDQIKYAILEKSGGISIIPKEP